MTPGVPNGERRAERVWLKDLARYLHCRTSELKRLAAATNALHSLCTHQTKRIYFVYPEVAMRLIAAIRARQGEELGKGNDVVKNALEGRERYRRIRAALLNK